MFLKKCFNKKTGRTQLSISHGYRDHDGKSKHRTIRSLGYLDELQKKYDDPVAYFTMVARKMDKERLETKYVTLTFDANASLCGGGNRKNYGHIIFSKIYHELEINRFLNNARRHQDFHFNSEAIMRLLVFIRLLYPGSKRASVLNKELFFDNFDFTIDDVYDALTHFDGISENLQKHLHEQVVAQYGRKTDLVYYDVTNYYFETDKQDALRKRGASKDHQQDPIVQMGLLLDKAGLPVAYKLYPGNRHDSQTLMPMLTEVKRNLSVKRIIAVADKGLNSGDNIAYNTVLGDGYIYSKSIRGAGREFQDWVLDEGGYRALAGGGRLKSRIVPDATISITGSQNGARSVKRPFRLEQKQVVYYSEKYAARTKHKREEAVAKALDMIASPGKYRRSFDYGAAGYITNLKVSKDTGEILNVKDTLLLDIRKIKEEERLDGYYALVTSELDDTDEHIISMYKGLWRIEESFKVTKSVLGARPIYLQTEKHINAHFLTCFIALLIARITELRLDGKYSIAGITDALRKVACSHLDQNIWLFDYANEVTDYIGKAFDVDLRRKVMTLGEITTSLGKAKKTAPHTTLSGKNNLTG
jgi:hypothetical protein